MQGRLLLGGIASFLVWLMLFPLQAKGEMGKNLVVNGGFEIDQNGDGLPDGWNLPPDLCALDTSTFHSPSHSLRYTRLNKEDYRLIHQRIPCKPGKLYRFSVWVKGEDIKVGDPYGNNGAGICIEWTDKDGKWLGGNYPPCISGTFGWRKIENLVRIPEEAHQVTLTLYLRSHNTGTAWFDDVEVIPEVSSPILNLFLIYPPYRGFVEMPTQGKRVSIRVEVNREDYDLEGKPLSIRLLFKDKKGKVLVSSQKNLRAEETETTIALPLPSLAEGDYILQCALLLESREVDEVTKEIKVGKKMPWKVYIDSRGRLIVDGKPFFPLGLYLGPTEDEHLERMAKAGFNTILCYGYGVGPEPEAFLERAKKHNLKVIYSIKDFYEGTAYFPQRGKSGLELAREYVKKLRAHPALLAWYINDELSVSWLPKLGRMYDLVGRLDPDHPQFQVLCIPSEFPFYYDCTDILGVDPYPIPSRPVSMVVDWTDKAVSAMRGIKPVWVVPQIFDWSIYSSDRTPRDPTYEEKKCMFYLALIRGAKGLIAYSYFDLLRTTGGKPAPGDVFEKRWEEVRKIAGEINHLIPILLEGEEVKGLPSIVGDGRVFLRCLEHGGKLYLLVANASGERVEISIPLPVKSIRSAFRLDGTKVKFQANLLRDALNPLEATTYIISK